MVGGASGEDIVKGVFDDIPAEDVAAAAALATAAAYASAQTTAAEYILAEAAETIGEPIPSAVAILLARPQNDPRYRLLKGLELDWMLLTARILNGVLRPTEAVKEARRRGATWTQIGAALNVTPASAQQRFKDV